MPALVALIIATMLTAAMRMINLTGLPRPAGEATHVAQVYAIEHLGHLAQPLAETAATPIAWLQMVGYTWPTGAFARATSPLAAVAELMVLAAVLDALLLWTLARRLGVSDWGAVAAVALVAVDPLAIGLQRVVLPENLAVTWVLAALVLLTGRPARRWPVAEIGATACLIVATLTAPISIALLPAAAILAWRRGRHGGWLLALLAVFALDVVFGVGPAMFLSTLDGGADPAPWLALDRAVPAVVLVVALAALLPQQLRPVAIGFLTTAAALLVPNADRLGALALLVPLGALLLTGMADTGIRRLTRHPEGDGRHAAVRPLAVPTMILVAILAITAMPGWVAGAATIRTRPASSPALSDAARWLRDNAAEVTVLTDPASWVVLQRTGQPADRLALPASCNDSCDPRDWIVATPALRAEPSAAVQAALRTSQPVAAFGSPAARVEVRRAATLTSPAQDADELKARTSAGAVLADSTRLSIDLDVDDLLRTGRVDPRVLSVLAALVAIKPVQVGGFPPIDGEDEAGQPRRQVLITSAGEQAEQITVFLRGQRNVFRPESITTTPFGVLARYPPVAPAGLLAPFSTP